MQQMTGLETVERKEIIFFRRLFYHILNFIHKLDLVIVVLRWLFLFFKGFWDFELKLRSEY